MRVGEMLTSERILYCIMFFFLLKPDYFSFLGSFTILYNSGFLVAFCVLLLSELKDLKVRKLAILVFAITVFPLVVSLIDSVQLPQSAFIPVLQTIGLIVAIEKNVKKRSMVAVSGLALLLEIYTYVNFFSIILYPEGLYDAAFYSGNYWFLGYKNVMIRFLLPAIVLNAIWTVYSKKKYNIRLYILIAISVATEWLVDCKTGIIGIAIVVITMIIFTKRELPQFINVRNGLICIGGLSILLATTSLLNEFSGILAGLGETVSVFSRQAVWFRSVQLFINSPIIGYGLRTNEGYRQLINLSTGWGYFSHPHNYLLYVLIQGGLVELLMIGYLITKVSRICLKNRNNYMAKMLIVFYIASFVMGITESLVGYTLLFPMALLTESLGTVDVKYDYE